MPSGVSVEKSAVNGGISCCKTSMQELTSSAHSLRSDYQNAGAGGWNDKQYTALGVIVQECCDALTKPISQLQECQKKLEQLLAAIMEYEGITL